MSIEAMKQALEALEHLQPNALTSFYTIGDRDKAIKSLRQAIAEAEKQEPVDSDGSPCPEFWDWLPKAYRDGDIGDAPRFTKYNMEVAFLAGKQSTHPPKREWVGLTPDEVFRIADQHPVEGFDPDIMAYTRAIEAKLKEKNT